MRLFEDETSTTERFVAHVDAMRGRVVSVYNLAFRAGIPLGALALGRIIPLVGISAALAGAVALPIPYADLSGNPTSRT